MTNEFDFIPVPLDQCEAFCEWKSPHYIAQFVERPRLQLPDWFVPGAHGGAIAGPRLMHSRGYSPATFRPRGWRKRVGIDGHVKELDRSRHLVRRCGGFFSVERSVAGRPWAWGVVLTVLSMPIFTRTVEEAMFLSQLDKPGANLRWVELNEDVDIDTAGQFVHVKL
jgi:hypothetical protein